MECLGPADARLAGAPGHDRGVGGLPAPGREDPLGRIHPADVVGFGHRPHEDDAVAGGRPFLGGAGIEDRLARRGAGRCVEAGGDDVDLGLGIPLGMQELVEGGRVHPQDRLLLRDLPFLHEVHGDLHGGGRGPLADPGLQHPELALLDGELDVAHVPVVVLQGLHDLDELLVGGGVAALQLVERQRGPGTGDDVLALGLRQVLGEVLALPGRGVAGEGDAGAGVLADVAEHHGDDVDGGAEVVRDPVLAAVDAGPLAVPGLEHRPDGHLELGHGVVREGDASLRGSDLFEAGHEAREVLGPQFGVGGDVPGQLRPVDLVLEALAGDAHHDLAEHLDETAVGIGGEALVAVVLRQAGDRGVVEPQVEDGVHHAGHRELGPRAHRDKQGVLRVAEPAAHLLLKRLHVPGDLVHDALGQAPLAQVLVAGLGGDREARRHRQAQVGHLPEVGALAPEQVLHVPVALLEVVDVLRAAGFLLFGGRFRRRLGCLSHRLRALPGRMRSLGPPRPRR